MLVIGPLIAFPVTGFSGGEHQRRFAIELALLAGDSRLLLEQNLPTKKRNWIEQRIVGELNILPLLSRYFLQEAGRADSVLTAEIKALQKITGIPVKLHRQALLISNRYSIRFSIKLSSTLKQHSQKEISKLYNSLCLGCHKTPTPEKSVLIGTLGEFARSMSDEEWIARLIGGLHGDAYTSYENPFTDEQIASLFIYIRSKID